MEFLSDKDIQMSILKGLLEDVLDLIDKSKATKQKIPFFKSAVFRQESEFSYKLIQSPTENLSLLQQNDWLYYARLRSGVHLKETISTGLVEDDATVVFMLIVFEHKNSYIIAAKSANKFIEDYICEIKKKNLKDRSVLLLTDWKEDPEFDFLTGEFFDHVYFH